MNDLIDRQVAIDVVTKHYRAFDNDLLELIAYEMEHLPSAQPEIIKCMDCKYYTLKPGPNSVNCYVKHCTRSARASTSPDDYCSRGERRTDD